MLKLTSKQYEIEETVQVDNDKGEVIYSFEMQITPDELFKIRNIFFDKEVIGKDKTEKELLDRGLKLQEEFETICFKEHKEPFKKACGDYKYLEMVETMFSFFMNLFIEKRNQQVNTLNSNLKKTGKI